MPRAEADERADAGAAVEPSLADVRRWRDEDSRRRGGVDPKPRHRRAITVAVVGTVIAVVVLFTPLFWLDLIVVVLVALTVASEGLGGRGMLAVRRRREVLLRQRGVPPSAQVSAPAAYDADAWERERRRRADGGQR